MAQIIIRNIPEDAMDVIKTRARRKGIPTEQEIRQMIVESARRTDSWDGWMKQSTRLRNRLAAGERNFTDSTDAVREDRESR